MSNCATCEWSCLIQTGHLRQLACPTTTRAQSYYSPIRTPFQSNFGGVGNLELIVALKSGGFAHFWRNNEDDNLPWQFGTTFGEQAGTMEAVTLIQSNFGDPGNLDNVLGSKACGK